MSDLDSKLRARIDSFIAELTGLVRSAALESVQVALGGSPRASSRSAVASNGATAMPVHARPSLGAKRGSGQKRDPSILAKTVETLAAYVAGHPGERLEDIAKGLSLPSQDLKLPVIKLLANKTITKKGQKRGTRYFPGKQSKA